MRHSQSIDERFNQCVMVETFCRDLFSKVEGINENLKSQIEEESKALFGRAILVMLQLLEEKTAKLRNAEEELSTVKRNFKIAFDKLNGLE